MLRRSFLLGLLSAGGLAVNAVLSGQGWHMAAASQNGLASSRELPNWLVALLDSSAQPALLAAQGRQLTSCQHAAVPVASAAEHHLANIPSLRLAHLEHAGPAHLRQVIALQCKQEFLTDRVIDIDGWLLSQTEVCLAVLAAERAAV